MHLLLLDEVRPEPWRNGGGVTRPLVSAREAGSASTGSASADWRLSLADISADAEFSVFPGMQRHAVLLGSGAVGLASNGAEPVWVRPLQPVSFPGEPRWHARRDSGSLELRFLNLMVRRSVLRGELQVIECQRQVHAGTAWALLPLAGRWQLSSDVIVGAGQLAWDEGNGGCLMQPLQADASAVLALVHSI